MKIFGKKENKTNNLSLKDNPVSLKDNPVFNQLSVPRTEPPMVVKSDKELMQTCLVERMVSDGSVSKNEGFKIELDALTVQVDNLKKAGLEAQYDVKSRELTKFMADEVTKENIRLMKEKGYIVVAIPPFHNQWKTRTSYFRDSVQFTGVLLSEYNRNDELNETHLVKCPVEKFMGEVPDSVVKEIIQIKNEGFTPEIWFVSKVNEIENYMSGVIVRPVDPILVALSDKFAGYAVVRAIWGKDIEDIDRFFAKQEAENELSYVHS